MNKNENKAKEKIINSTIELIQHHGDVHNITMRGIAAKAEVGVGLINYHFQSKDNLVNICIQRIISSVIDKFEPMYKGLEMKPIDKLRFLAKSTAAFLASQPEISRISILTDLSSGKSDDNSMQTINAYTSVLKEIYGTTKTEYEIFILMHIFISAVQAAFLRKEVIKATRGIDFFNIEQRNKFIDDTIDCIFHDCL